MRKIILSLVAFMALYACSDDGNKTTAPITTGELNGKWELAAEYEDGVRQGLDNCRLQEELQFNNSALITVTATTNQNSECNFTASEGNYTRTGNSLVFEMPSGRQFQTIVELTDTKLVIAEKDGITTQEYKRL